jgi:two-component system sensor histidine kinase KdpD
VSLPITSGGRSRRNELLRSRARVLAYVSAVLGPAVLVSSKHLFTESPGETPFLLLLGQIALAGAIGGLFPALLGTLVSALSVMYLLLPPSASFSIASADADRVLLFVVEGLIVSAIVGFLHRSWHETRHALEATRAADERVREAWRMRTNFYAAASHDIRRPLTRLLTQLQLARRQLTTSDVGGPLARRLDASIDAATALSRLMDDLLESARSGKDVAPAPREPVDLALLVSDIRDEFVSGPRQATLELERPPREIWIKADATGLSKAIRNLVENGLRYGNDRTVLLEVVVGTNGREALVRVSDHGIGIPIADRDRIFEPFYRASNVGSSRGHGLGLSISRRIVEEHGGRLWLDRCDQDGTTFALAVPLLTVNSN